MNLVCSLGLYPFLLCFIFYRNDNNTFHKWIPIIIFTNGFLYHILFNNYILIRLLDVYTNLGLCIYINYYTSKQPYTLAITLLVFIVFYLNIYSNVIHILYIQMTLLHLYIKSKPVFIYSIQ